MIRTQISMTVEHAEALRRVAATRRISQAAVLRDALDLVVASEEQDAPHRPGEASARLVQLRPRRHERGA